MTTPAKLKLYAGDPQAFLEDLTLPSALGVARFGNVMADFQRERFESIAPALVALARGERPDIGRFWWEASKGTSKDTDLSACILWLLAFAKRPLTCQVGAADADQAAELRRAASGIMHANPWLSARLTIDKWLIACKDTGGTCDIIPADVTGSHGARPDLLVLNELSHIGKQEYAENLMDNASKVPHGVVVVATNAGHTGTWQYDWRQLAVDSDRWIVEQFAEPAPWLDPEELAEAAKRNSPTRFNRLFYGVWSPNSGDFLDPQAVEDCIVLQGPMHSRPNDNWGFILGVDLGVSHDHSAVCLLGTEQGSGTITLCDCKSWAPPAGGQIDLSQVERAIVGYHARFRLRKVVYDPYQAVMLAQSLERRGIRTEPFNFVGQNLTRLASTLLEVVNCRSLAMYRHDALLRDLARLQIVERSYGVKLESVRDQHGHADLATNLAIALPAALELSHLKAFASPGPPQRLARLIEPARWGINFEGTRRWALT